MLAVAAGQMDEATFARWLRDHARLAEGARRAPVAPARRARSVLGVNRSTMCTN